MHRANRQESTIIPLRTPSIPAVHDTATESRNNSSYVFDGHKLMYHLGRVARYLEKGDCGPIYLELSPVGRCNHRCIFCAYDHIGYPDRMLPTDRVLMLLEELKLAGLRSILFAGEGEPLLHPDLPQFVHKAHECGIDSGIFTNGQLLTPDKSAAMLPHLTFVRFSINAGTPERFARIHSVKQEVFGTVLDNLREACRIKREHGLTCDIGVQFVLLPENADTLPEAARRVKAAGADYLAVKPFVQQHLQSYRLDEPLPYDEVEDIFRDTESLADEHFAVIARRDSFLHYGERNYRHCCGTSFITVINSAGDVASCLPRWEQEDFVYGNIHHDSFNDIWSGERRRTIKHRLETELDLSHCPPNCRANAINEFLGEIQHPTVKHLNFI